MTDEGNPGGGASCTSNLPGICMPGTTTCQTGSLNCVSNVMPTTEACNGLDDNCDGMADNAPIAILCPPPPGVSTTSCGGTGCQIVTCGAQNYNLDGMYANGCECNDPAQTTCMAPHDLGSIAVGGTTTAPVNRAPAATGPAGEDYYLVAFPATGSSGSGRGGGRPTIEFAAGSDASFRFDVFIGSQCTTPLNCGRNNMAPLGVGLTSWDFYDQNTDTAGTSQWVAPRNPWPSTVRVRVYRNTATQSCASYQLRARRP
jgi:hypothetical protein